MQFTLAIAAFAAAAYAQECTKADYTGSFVINPKNVSSSSKRDLHSRQSSACADVTTTLKGGVLLNSKGSTGEIVANYQFQYDNPLQVDNRNHDGFFACDNGTLALNGNAVFYQCNVNDGPGLLYSPFLSPVTGQCFPVYFEIVDCSSSGSGGSVTVAADGQPQATSCVPVTITSDGQPQVVTNCPTSSSCVAATITKDGQVQVSSCPTSSPSTCVAATVTKDGQVQVSSCPTSTTSSTCVAATIISDGQPQVISCPTPTPTSVCVAATITSDGQVQVSSCPTSGVAAGTQAAPSASSTFIGVSPNAGNIITVGSQIAFAVFGLAVVAFL